jgi:hypothetical protein
LSQFAASRQQTLHAAVALLGRFQNCLDRRVLAETVEDLFAAAQRE